MEESIVSSISNDNHPHEDGIFRDRRDAGERLAKKLSGYLAKEATKGGTKDSRGGDLLVLALPRGGVPVAFEVARLLQVPLDLFLVRKLGVPGEEELAFGAIAPGGVRHLNAEIVRDLRIGPEEIERVVAREEAELCRREQLYRGGRPPREITGRIVILIDDGIATGATMRAAIAAILGQSPQKVIVAVPVTAAETCRQLNSLSPLVSCISIFSPSDFGAVGFWYADFPQVPDEEVCRLLTSAADVVSNGGLR